VTIELLPAAARAALPWKNGGGVTREVAVHPRGSGFDTLEWRVSIAQVRSAGPFSSLPGLDRHLAVLEGTLSLVIGQAPEVRLSPATPALSFPGEVPVQAQPLDGPVMDLNIMTRRGRFSSALTMHHAQHPTPLASDAATVVVVALTELMLSAGKAEWQLSHLDGARIEGEGALQIHPLGDQARFYMIQLHGTRSV
jgi:uncharacterized protein